VSAAPWWGLGGPAGLPREMVNRMNAAIVQGLTSKEVVDRLAGVGIEAAPSTPEEFDTFLHAEYTRWGNLIQRAGIKSQ
jgi:tripartite-type tricarboxylate transporter receptor subunit TctC